MRTKLFFFAGALLAVVGGVVAGSVELEPKETAPPPTITDDQWHFNLGSPGWMASLSGEVGLQGVNVDVDVGFDKIIKHVDSLMSLSAEVRKGRFGAYGDFLYMDLSDPVYPKNIISKVDIFMSQYVAVGAVYYRVLEGQCGWIELRAGAGYSNVYTKLELTDGTPSR